MTTPTDDGNPGLEKVGTVMRDMLNVGRQPTPPVTPAELRRRAEQSRHRRIDSKVVVALVAVAAVIAALIVIGPLHSGPTPAHKPTPTHPGSTTTTSTTTTTTTTTIPAAAASALDTYVADEEQTDSAAATSSGAAARYGLSPFVADHSAPVVDDGHTVAVAAFSYEAGGHPVQVLQYSGGQWAPVAELPPPTGQSGSNIPNPVLFLTQDPVAVADVTGDGQPDFLITASAADNVPGFVVSQDGGTWRYIPFSGPYAPTPTDVMARSPQFQGNTLVSDYNNCIPDCAGGQNTTIVWTYQPSSGEFTAPYPPGYVTGATPGACLASSLSVSAAPGSGAGGHEAVVVVFTNTSSATCSLDGYPTTAWFEGPGGVHLPAPVTQEVVSGPVTKVTLAPGQTAATTVWTDDPAGLSSSSCNPVAANAVTVGIGADTSALTTPIAVTVCSTNNSVGTTPFTAGTTQSPM